MAGNGIGCASEPFLVVAKGQVLGRVALDAVANWMAEGFEQSGRRQHRDVMGFETEKPSGLTPAASLLCTGPFPGAGCGSRPTFLLALSAALFDANNWGGHYHLERAADLWANC